jgi:hypothetical protein
LANTDYPLPVSIGYGILVIILHPLIPSRSCPILYGAGEGAPSHTGTYKTISIT